MERQRFFCIFLFFSPSYDKIISSIPHRSAKTEERNLPMWILYTILGILAALFVLSAAAAAVLFFGTLYRTPKKNAAKKVTLDTSSLNDNGMIASFREQCRAETAWFESLGPRDVCITADDGVELHAEVLEAENARATVLLMHGFLSSPKHDFSLVFRFYRDKGFNIVAPYQRALGKSGGNYVTFGDKERYDCKRWAEWIRDTYGKDLPIVMDGVSMGASTILMSVGLGLPENMHAIIADCGYTTPWEIVCTVIKATKILPIFPCAHIAKLFARIFGDFSFTKPSTIEAMKTCKLPILIAHGTKDRFVPYEMSVRNFEACASEKKTLFTVEDAGHGMCFLVDLKGYEHEIENLLKDIL